MLGSSLSNLEGVGEQGRRTDATIRAGLHEDVISLRYFLNVFSAAC